MWRKAMTILMLLLATLFSGSTAWAQQQVQRDNSDDNYDYDSEYIDRDYSQEYDNNDRYSRGDYVSVDRYLDADIWVNQSDNEYYIGDNIAMNYRVNRDAFVAIISIDSRGRVNLLYPSQPGDNPWRQGGVTYRLPGANDDFDLVVDGPEGVETIQIIASRERFPIPDWFNGSGIRVREDDDRDEFMDYLVERYFERYNGQRFAIDREVIYVEDWEPAYFRPVYYPTYPGWSVCGNVYIDYPWGSSVYIDGVYWGCTPLYIPRILVGWRTFTVYDPWGYCWEDYIHVSHYNTIVLNHTVIRPQVHVRSKYKEVHVVGYRDPVKAGYSNYHEVVKKQTTLVGKTTVDPHYGTIDKKQRPTQEPTYLSALPKKHVRGSGDVIRTDRGYESSTIGERPEKRSRSGREVVKSRFDGDQNSGRVESYRPEDRSGSGDYNRNSYGETSRKRSSGSSTTARQGSSGDNGSSSNYYRKKSGSVERKRESGSNDSGEKVGKGREDSGSRESQPERKVEQQQPENRGNDRGAEAKPRSSDGGGQKQAAPRGNSGGQSGEKRGRR